MPVPLVCCSNGLEAALKKRRSVGVFRGGEAKARRREAQSASNERLERRVRPPAPKGQACSMPVPLVYLREFYDNCATKTKAETKLTVEEG